MDIVVIQILSYTIFWVKNGPAILMSVSNYLDSVFVELGSCGRNVVHGHNASHFFLYCVCLVCFLCKYTEFHYMRTECQIIPIHFLLLTSRKSAACSKSASLFAIVL